MAVRRDIYELQHVKNMVAYNRKLERIFKFALMEIAKEIKRFQLRNPDNFKERATFKQNKALEKKIDKILRSLNTEILTGIDAQVNKGWSLANIRNKQYEANYLKSIGVNLDSPFGTANLTALDAFLRRKKAGLTLSDRVWNIRGKTKDQIEAILSSGITQGKSAIKISKDLEQFVKGEKVKHAGGLLKGINVVDQAIRLAVTETNMAFRISDTIRRKQLPFVVAIVVHLSPAHPVFDICDEMIGEYPPGFNFIGWHPRCICFTTAKTLSKKDFIKYLETGKVPKSKYAAAIPKRASNYLKTEPFENWKRKPFWIDDNFESNGTSLNSQALEVPEPRKRRKVVS